VSVHIDFTHKSGKTGGSQRFRQLNRGVGIHAAENRTVQRTDRPEIPDKIAEHTFRVSRLRETRLLGKSVLRQPREKLPVISQSRRDILDSVQVNIREGRNDELAAAIDFDNIFSRIRLFGCEIDQYAIPDPCV